MFYLNKWFNNAIKYFTPELTLQWYITIFMLHIKELVYTTTQTTVKTNTSITNLPIMPMVIYIMRSVASNFLDSSIGIFETAGKH